MSYDDGTFTGLTRGTLQQFNMGFEQVQLAISTDGHEGPPETAFFAYDDTAFGAVPAGILRTLATCAGELAQLIIRPISSFNSGVFGVPSGAHTLNLLTASMTGVGGIALADGSASDTADALVTVGSELPLTFCPSVMLLRPTPIAPRWAGRDDSNTALRTLWLPDEIAPVAYNFQVTAADVELWFDWQAQGWNVA